MFQNKSIDGTQEEKRGEKPDGSKNRNINGKEPDRR
jgi:hypothetical protein